MIDTSFAVLFLLRTTQATISRITLRGTLVHGKDLLVVETRPIDDVIDDLEASEINEIDSSLPAQLALSVDPLKRANELVRLRRMVISGPNTLDDIADDKG